MREIKFRYRVKIQEKVITLILSQEKIEDGILSGLSSGIILSKDQWIGFKDDNKKEIYEGDICKQPDGKIIQVGMGTAYVDYIKQPLEVIGNIYENPELLK